MYFIKLFLLFCFLILFCFGTFCQSLSSFDFSPEKAEQVELGRGLKEISGLTFTKAGKLFTHGDEKGNIFQINPESGAIIKKFRLGERAVYNDFEGIAAAGKKIFLISSRGELYLFYEQKDKSYARYAEFKTTLSGKNNVEGLCFDPSTYTLLIACKGDPGEDYQGYKAVYSFDITKRELNKKPRFLISLGELEKKFSIKKFSPSGIERNSKTGTFFVLSSNEKCILEISPGGKLLNAVKLNHKFHKQPEGITVTDDSVIIIGDEGGKGEGTLTRYFLK